MFTEIIKLVNVTKKYLKISFNLSIKEHELVIIKGKNGSGKSTLLKLILQFIKPDSGTLLVSKEKIAYLPERVMLPSYIKVLDYLLLMTKIKKVDLPLAYLEELKIPLSIEIQKLSKGNKQKVAIITALMGNEELVLLDEPLSGLDRSMQYKVRNIIKNEQLRKTIVISTHNPLIFKKIANQEIEIC